MALSRRQFRFSFFAVILGAFLLRVLLIYLFGAEVPPTADGKFYHVVAQRIAAGEGYTWLWPDGAITYAAHYPVGYPALMAIFYAPFSAQHQWAQLGNALFGSLYVWATMRVAIDFYVQDGRLLSLSPPKESRRAILVVGMVAALLPTLLVYTLALMTEGVVTSCLLASYIFLRVAAHAWREGARSSAVVKFVLGASFVLLSTYLRPQSIVLAPVLGASAYLNWQLPARAGQWKGALLWGGLVSLLVGLGCLPWTLRNCDVMGRCMLVSANGGWNLLIGTFAEGNGAWVPLDAERIPSECLHVYDEAQKDLCFGDAGKKRIFENFWSWLSLVPAKLSATFEFSNAAAAHLSEAGSLKGKGYGVLSGLEILCNRLVVLLAVIGLGRELCRLQKVGQRVFYGVVVLVVLSQLKGWVTLALVALLVLLLLNRRSYALNVAGVLSSTLLIHAVFFGAGRYGLVVYGALVPLAVLALSPRNPQKQA